MGGRRRSSGKEILCSSRRCRGATTCGLGGKPSWRWESKQVSCGCGQTVSWPSGSLFEPGQRQGAIGFRRLPSLGKRSNCFSKTIFSRGVPRSQGPQRDFFQKEGKTGSRSGGLGTRGLARRPSLPAGPNRDREKALLQPTRCPPLEGLPLGLSSQGIEDKTLDNAAAGGDRVHQESSQEVNRREPTSTAT